MTQTHEPPDNSARFIRPVGPSARGFLTIDTGHVITGCLRLGDDAFLALQILAVRADPEIEACDFHRAFITG